MPDELDPQLIRYTKDTYGDSFKAHLFEQYKHYVESADKLSERRVSANNYLLTVNALLTTFYGLLSSISYKGGWAVLIPIAGIVVSLTWLRLITSYRNLNSVKFKVIHQLEQEMPAAIYEYEWKKAEEGRGKTYHPVTHLERWVPVVFMLLYFLVAILKIWELVREYLNRIHG